MEGTYSPDLRGELALTIKTETISTRMMQFLYFSILISPWVATNCVTGNWHNGSLFITGESFQLRDGRKLFFWVLFFCQSSVGFSMSHGFYQFQ